MDSPVMRANVVGRKARRRAVPDVLPSSSSSSTVHIMPSDWLLDEAHQAVQHVRQRRAGRNQLQHLMLGGAKRLLPPALGDVARDPAAGRRRRPCR